MVWDDDIWNDLLDERDGPVAVLHAYVDASTRAEHGLLSAATYLFDSKRARKFRREWRQTFGDQAFSWADLVACSKQFKYLRDNKTEHNRLIAAGVALVREYVAAGCIASIWTQDVEQFGPTWINGFGHAYSIAGHMAMVGLGKWASEHNYKGGIRYIIESGDEGYDQLERLLSYPAKVPAMAEMYQWAGHSIVPKTPCAPFHAPDLLAWEWGKFVLETGVTAKRPMRLSFAHLLVNRLDTYSFHHLAGPPLMKFFNRIHDLGVEQMQEDRDALASVQPVDVTDAVQASEQTELVGDHE